MDSTAMISLAGSAFSTVVTAYFWMVKMRRERPQLEAFALDREFFLGTGNAETRQIGFKAGLIVANYSALPNALVGAKLALKSKEGGWIEVTPLAFDKATPLPLNLPSLHTVLLRLQGNLTFPYTDSLEQGNKAIPAYLQNFLAEPRQTRLELHSLNHRIDTFTLDL